jgi:hypothetical protein
MAANFLRLADLSSLPDAERERRVTEFAAGRNVAPNGELGDLGIEIARFETRYEMSSATMRQKLIEGVLAETEDICSWLMLLSLRDKLAAEAL